ncbi:MAG: hypothetical protein ACRCY3_14915 [Sphingorhabdus sp.]
MSIKPAAGQFKNVKLSEAKRLIGLWSKGNHSSLKASLEYHVGKHGSGDLTKYLRKAENFNYKGATKSELENGATRWNRKNGEFIIKDENGKIVSYGPEKSAVIGSLIKR